MGESTDKIAAGRQVELVIRKLESLSTLPEVAAGFLSYLADGGGDSSLLNDIIESDPALTAKLLSLAHDESIAFSNDIPSVAEAVAKLPKAVVRDAVLSVKVFQAFDADFDPDRERVLPRRQLAVHALAVACCASQIADMVLPARDKALAFSAGLLHDIGKLAIDEVMPRSFEKIVEQARSQSGAMHAVEQASLGVDHTIVGKRLAEKWSLADEVIYAIWLHHSDIETISANMPGAKIALVVQLADIVARQGNLGLSGSFNVPGSVSDICNALGLSGEQLEAIRQNLPEEVARRSRLSGLTERGGQIAWCDLVADTAARMARDNTELSKANTATGATSAQMEFVADFLGDLEPNELATDVAARFAVKLQRHYQTGPVCVYIPGDAESSFVELVTVDKSGKTDTIFVDVPSETAPIAKSLQREFVVADAGDHAGWLFEQVGFEIDLSRAKIAPLLAGGSATAAVVFETRMPFDPARGKEVLSIPAGIAGSVIGVAVANARHNRLAERFADLLGKLKQTRDDIAEAKSLAALAEMAAGAAHELNNPLAVISGRAQLLLDSETDDNKKQTLKQIQERGQEMSQMVEDLMNFARPKKPEPSAVSLRKLVDEAVAKTQKKHKLDSIEAEFKGIDELGEVLVDKSQVADAIANIVSNCLDSYQGGAGPIVIDGGCPQAEGAVVFSIADSGSGMDADTMAKACQPFFSAREAGRKRGMGLAQTLRMLQSNKGSMSIASEPGKGTTVTVTLPKN